MKRRKNRPKRPPFRPTPASVAGDGILLFLALFGAVFSFLTAFSADADAPLVLAGCGACTAVSLLTWSLPRRWWILPLAGTAALWGWGLWKLWDYLALGEITLRCAVVNTFCTSLSLDDYIQPIAQLPDETWALCAALLVLAALLPLSLLLGLTIQRARSFWLTFWVTLPFPLAPVCISVTPGWLPLMALVLVWCTMGLTSLVRRQDARGAARLTLAVLPAGALLLTILTFAMPQEHYQRPRWADTALNDITNWAARQDFALFQGSGPFGLFGSGGSLSSANGEVDLSHAGPLGFSGRTVLEVETDLRGRIYLRGFSCGVYNGGSWAPLDQDIYDSEIQWGGDDLSGAVSSLYRPTLHGYQPMNFPALADREEFPDKEYAKVTVRNVGADPGYVYVPYQILSQPSELGGAAFVNDSYIARMEDVWTHTVYVQPDCDPMDEAELPGDAEGPEKNYRIFVQRNYLDIPEESMDALALAMQEIALETYYGSDKPAYQEYRDLVENGYVIGMDSTRTLPLALANVVAAYLEDAAEYNPDTPVTPEGEDFVSWFLTESHEGYCMHFASAATLLLRYLGIPARYVVGYVADVPASGKVKVPDSAAHAWVEIYLEGYGWEPIEVTPAYSGGTPGQSSTAAATPTPTATPKPTATAAPTASAAPTPTPSQNPGTAPEDGEALDLRVVVIPLMVVLVILALPASRAFGRSRREKKFRQENTNQAVIAAYLQLKRLEKWGGEVPEEIFELAKKAKFSPHTLTEEEREQAVSAARTAAARVDKALPWYRKFWCRYILGLC